MCPTSPSPFSLSVRAKLLWIFGLVLIDQGSKYLAIENIQGYPPRLYLGGIFRLEFAINPGAFLSLGSSLSPDVRFWVFIVAVGGFLLGASWVLFRDRTLDRVNAFALSIIVGGGIGNLIDRSARANHGVVDFLNLGLGDLRTGIFNIADMAIMLGVILLGWKSFQGHKSTEKNPVSSAKSNSP